MFRFVLPLFVAMSAIMSVPAASQPYPDPAAEMWLEIRESDDRNLFEEFVTAFPTSPYVHTARARLRLLERSSEPRNSSFNGHSAVTSSTVAVRDGMVRIRDAVMTKDYRRLQNELDTYASMVDYPLPPSVHYLYALAAMRSDGDIVSGYYHVKAFMESSDANHPQRGIRR